MNLEQTNTIIFETLYEDCAETYTIVMTHEEADEIFDYLIEKFGRSRLIAQPYVLPGHKSYQDLLDEDAGEHDE